MCGYHLSEGLDEKNSLDYLVLADMYIVKYLKDFCPRLFGSGIQFSETNWKMEEDEEKSSRSNDWNNGKSDRWKKDISMTKNIFFSC